MIFINSLFQDKSVFEKLKIFLTVCVLSTSNLWMLTQLLRVRLLDYVSKIVLYNEIADLKLAALLQILFLSGMNWYIYVYEMLKYIIEIKSYDM